MARKSLKYAALVIALSIFGYASWLYTHALTDKEAIQIITSFSQKLGVSPLPHKLSVKSKGFFEALILGIDTVPIVFSDNQRKFALINQKKKEVISLHNPDVDDVLRKLAPGDRKPWPPFLFQKDLSIFIGETAAKTILLQHANRVGLPNDVGAPKFTLNKDYGVWSATWQRQHNGYFFEKDHISISIIAVDGQFYSYYKSFEGEPCKTEVKIKKAEAIQKGQEVLIKYITNELWEKNKDKFELVSAELKIVNRKSYLHNIFPFYKIPSRLAWVVEFDVKRGQEMNTIAILNKDKSIVHIDASTGKVIYDEINIVP